MKYTFFSLTMINIPLVLSEFLCCLMLISALTRKRPGRKRAALAYIPYSVILILPGDFFYLWGLFDSLLIQLVNMYLEVAACMLLLKAAYREEWKDTPVTASTVVFLFWLLDDMEGFFLTDNYDLSVPGDLAAYMTVNCLAILVLVGLARAERSSGCEGGGYAAAGDPFPSGSGSAGHTDCHSCRGTVQGGRDPSG